MNKKIKNILLILLFTFIFVFSESSELNYHQIAALCFTVILISLRYVKKLYWLVPVILIVSAAPLLFKQTNLFFLLVYMPVIWLLLANKIITEYKDQYYPLLVSVVAIVMSLLVSVYVIVRNILANTWNFNRVMVLVICLIILAVVQFVKRKKAKSDKSYNLWPLFIFYLLTLLAQVPVNSYYNSYQIGIYLLLPSVVFLVSCFQPSPKLKKFFA